MASLTRGETNQRKLQELETAPTKVASRQEHTEWEQRNLSRRLDKVEKCSTLVVESSSGTEEIYKTVEGKEVPPKTVEAALKELSHQLSLPVPLPELTPESWQQLTAETKMVALEQVKQWKIWRRLVFWCCQKRHTAQRTLVQEIGKGRLVTWCSNCTSVPQHYRPRSV